MKQKKIQGIYYVSSFCDAQTYQKAIDQFHGSGHAIQKYNRLLIDGFLQADKAMNVKAISAFWAGDFLPVNYVNGNLSVDYIVVSSKNTIQRYMKALFYTFLQVLRAPNGTVVMTDVLKIAPGLGALFAAKLRRFPTVGIVTDLPKDMPLAQYGWMLKTGNYIVNHQDSYVFLSPQMNDVINIMGKPYVVAEGQVDSQENDIPTAKPESRYINNVCIYAGSLHEKYGITKFIRAFMAIAKSSDELHIYGDGNAKDEIIAYAQQDSRIVYFGSVSNDTVVEDEKRATLLVNPRPSDQEYTKYSFPSKTLEYMVSGTPCLITKLPAIPPEYDNYVYYFDDETETGMAKALRRVLDLPRRELLEKGQNARRFVLQQKNNCYQAQRILSMINTHLLERE